MFSHWPFDMQTSVQSQISPCGIFSTQSGSGKGFASTAAVFFCPYLSTNAPYSFNHLSRVLCNLWHFSVIHLWNQVIHPVVRFVTESSVCLRPILNLQEMDLYAILSFDGLSFSGLAWTFKLQPSKQTQRPAYDMVGHSPVHFGDQHAFKQDSEG